MNRIVTRGMGTGPAGSAGLVTRGYGRFIDVVIDTVVDGARRVVRGGSKAAARALEEVEKILVWAKLVELNDHAPNKPVSGTSIVNVSNDFNATANVTLVDAKSADVSEGVVVKVTRVRKR